ncbi:MAG: DUF5682 family protein, partial [Pseudomonadota bacterium]
PARLYANSRLWLALDELGLEPSRRPIAPPVCWPFTTTTRFIDLPAGAKIAWYRAEKEARDAQAGTTAGDPQDPALRRDPLDVLAAAAGAPDGESWWQVVVEESTASASPLSQFDAIRHAIAAVREGQHPAPLDALREAFMRREIRKATVGETGPIAVLCGAYHAPALTPGSSGVKADTALLKGLAKERIEIAWVPWSYSKLSIASGYGAGVASPGWAEHLWHMTADETGAAAHSAAAWQTKVARLLREEGIDTSLAAGIEAARLATALAGLRNRASPGLDDMRDASLAALCHGERAPLRLIEQQLIVGTALGAVPESAPQSPLARDLALWQRRTRLKPETQKRTIALDLRSDSGNQRSTLLRRLALLGLPWGALEREETGRGTFREQWVLAWQPEFAASLAAASIFGATIDEAAAARCIDRARVETSLAAIARVLSDVLYAGLSETGETIRRILRDRAAVSGEVSPLIETVLPLARLVRYGTARRIETPPLADLAETLIVQIVAGLPYACRGIDADEARALRTRLSDITAAVPLLQRAETSERWTDAIHRLSQDSAAHAVLRGFAARSSLETKRLSPVEVAALISHVLSPGTPTAEASHWLEGFLTGSAALLMLDDTLFGLIDHWLTRLPETEFLTVLPLLRRAMEGYSAVERAQILRRLSSDPTDARRAGSAQNRQNDRQWNQDRIARALPLIEAMLGGTEPNKNGGSV